MRKALVAVLSACGIAFAALAPAQSHLICRLQDPLQAQTVASAYGIQLVDTTSPAPFVLFEIPAGTDVHFYQLAMAGDPRVIWAEDDGTLEPPEKQSGKGSVGNVIADRAYLAAENVNFLNQIGWNSSRFLAGRRVRIAVLDTGLSPNVPRLWNRVTASINAVPDNNGAWDLPYGVDTNGNGDVDEGAGHGTMVTGLIDLISQNVDLVIARVADSDGVATSWSIIKGLAFAASKGAEIANVSLGAIDRLNALSDVLDWTDEKRLLVIAPAGNGNTGDVLFPSGYSKVVCVTGVGADDRKAQFSNWGSDADIAAPAVGIRSAWHDGNTAVWSGTSFAAPIVSAVVGEALLRSTRTNLDSLRAAIELGGVNIDPLNPNYSGKLGRRINVQLMHQAIISRPK